MTTDLSWQLWSYPVAEAGLTLRGWHTPPTGRPLLHFLHGNGFCSRMYEPLLRRLARDFDLWRCDLPGHGISDGGDRFLGWNRNARHALAAFESLRRPIFGEVPVHAVGHSFGGALTALMMGRPGHPFRRAVLLDPAIYPPGLMLTATVLDWLGALPHTPLARGARRRRQHWPDRATAFRALWDRGAYRGWSAEGLQAFVDHALRDSPGGGVQLRCDPRLESAIFGSRPRRMWTAVRHIGVPTLITHARYTIPFIPKSVRHAARINPRIRALAVEGGHSFMQEDPDRAAALVRTHLLSPG